MLQIKYKIIDDFAGEIEDISEDEISYSFLLGSVSFTSSDAMIEMEWEWIPLLDMAYYLKEIARSLTANGKSKECFEFTENDETLEFSKEAEHLRISASFSSVVISTTIEEFEIATSNFHTSISKYIRENILLKEVPQKLQKYLSVEIL